MAINVLIKTGKVSPGREFIKDLPQILSGKSSKHRELREIFWGAFAREFFVHVSRSYDSRSQGQTDDIGRKFRRLSPATLSKKGPRIGILRATDRLYQSYKPGAYAGGKYRPPPEQVFDISGRGLKMGSSVPYAKEATKFRPIIPSRGIVSYDLWISKSVNVALNELALFLQRTLK